MNKTQAAITLLIFYTALAVLIGFVVNPIVGFIAWYSSIWSIGSTIEGIKE